jgi:hypothetical protein
MFDGETSEHLSAEERAAVELTIDGIINKMDPKQREVLERTGVAVFMLIGTLKQRILDHQKAGVNLSFKDTVEKEMLELIMEMMKERGSM